MAPSGEYLCSCGKSTWCYCLGMNKPEIMQEYQKFIIAPLIMTDPKDRNYPYQQLQIELGPINIDDATP